MSNQFVELKQNECLEITGGIAFVPALILVGKVVGGCAAVGFVGGVAYELIVG